MDAIAGDEPFIMKPDGLGWLFAPGRQGRTVARPTTSRSSRRSGTCCIPKQPTSPTVRLLRGAAEPDRRTSRRQEFPVVACTFRLTEHYLSGPMSRFNGWLNELQPEMFVELSPELAAGARHRRTADG